jgi:DNA-binding response OmpR family regulator
VKLLLVEDESRIARFLIRGLGRNGYEVEHVETGADALKALAQARHALVLLDLGLPDMDGLQVLEALRRANPNVPVIVLTAHATDRGRGLELGADEFLVKPVPFPQLLEQLDFRARMGRLRSTRSWPPG